jgi:intein-encoded DNA endonuclease-like protein
MTYSKYKQKKIGELKQKVFALYKQGYTLREVSDLIKKERSYTWILNAVKELEKPENIA